MPSTFRKTFHSFLSKLGIDARYSHIMNAKEKWLMENDPEYKHCTGWQLAFILGSFFVFCIGGICAETIYSALPIASIVLAIVVIVIGLWMMAMGFILNAKCEYISSQTPNEIVEERP